MPPVWSQSIAGSVATETRVVPSGISSVSTTSAALDGPLLARTML